MKILACSVRGGDVCATVLAEKEDCLRSGGGHAAVEGCIHRFADEKGLPALALARVTRMQETADGGIEFDFDAAVPPQVKLGKYLGLEVYVPADESPDLPVLRAAAETLEADIPETYISRKIDGLVRQRLEDVALPICTPCCVQRAGSLPSAMTTMRCGTWLSPFRTS